MEEIYSEAGKAADNFRKGIRESKYGLLKLAGIELIPMAMGAGLAGIGRITGAHLIPAVPIGLDLIGGGAYCGSPRGLQGLVKYGIGVAIPYADKIYLAAQENMPLISQTIENVLGSLK